MNLKEEITIMGQNKELASTLMSHPFFIETDG